MGIKHTRSVERVRVRVDVKVTFHFTIHNVYILSKRTGSALFAVRSTTNHIERKVFKELLCDVEVGCVTIHIALLVPTWIEHSTHWGVVIRLLRTTAQAHRVVLHDGVREEMLEPVGIAKFSLTQVSIASLFRVGKGKLASLRIESVDQFIHVTINSVVTTIEDFGEIEPTAIGKFAIDAHLVLWIENIEVAVGRDEACGKFACVVHMRLSLLTFLSGHYDDTRHGACTIDRGGTTVFQDLETLDVIGIETCDGRANQGFGVTRSQVVGIYIGHIFHDDTIDHPEGFRSTKDGGGTTHTDFRSRTKGATHVLYGDTSSASFERTTHIGYTAQTSRSSVYFISRTCKHTAVGLGETRNDDLTQWLCVFEGYLHVGRTFEGLRLHAKVANRDIEIFSLDGQREFTVFVSGGEASSAIGWDTCTKERLIVWSSDYNARNACLCKYGTNAQKQAEEHQCEPFLHRKCG